MRNSTSHPLKVNWIPIEGDNGRIGITLCPGKYQPVSWTGGWDRQISIDVATLVELKTDRLISLITDEDMELLRVTELPQVITEQGMAWDHLPLEDTTVPTRAWLEAAKPVFSSLLTSIPEGENVVVHCMGGLSRAGTFISIYLWLRGSSMANAIERVRTERDPRAINSEQEAFLQRLEQTGYIIE
jgi:ADP-ribosyl-[dinitrogen reductase] hydrolase